MVKREKKRHADNGVPKEKGRIKGQSPARQNPAGLGTHTPIKDWPEGALLTGQSGAEPPRLFRRYGAAASSAPLARLSPPSGP